MNEEGFDIGSKVKITKRGNGSKYHYSNWNEALNSCDNNPALGSRGVIIQASEEWFIVKIHRRDYYFAAHELACDKVESTDIPSESLTSLLSEEEPKLENNKGNEELTALVE